MKDAKRSNSSGAFEQKRERRSLSVSFPGGAARRVAGERERAERGEEHAGAHQLERFARRHWADAEGGGRAQRIDAQPRRAHQEEERRSRERTGGLRGLREEVEGGDAVA